MQVTFEEQLGLGSGVKPQEEQTALESVDPVGLDWLKLYLWYGMNLCCNSDGKEEEQVKRKYLMRHRAAQKMSH